MSIIPQTEPDVNPANEITVIEQYETIREEIVQPNRTTYETRYFLMKWEPTLGANAARIVRVLRSLGYYDRATKTERGGIAIDLPGLATLCGFSVATLKREFTNNPHLHRFVQREKNYKTDATTGQIWREENIYRVKMTDPIHPDDEQRARELAEARQKNNPPTDPKPSRSSENGRKAQNEPNGKSAASGKSTPSDRKAQNELNGEQKGKPRTAQTEPPPAQVASQSNQAEPVTVQDESDASQSELTLKTLTLTSSTSPLDTSSYAADAAPDVFTSLFSEEEPEKTSPPSWTALPEPQRASWLDRARGELAAIHAGSGVAVRPKLVEVRARNLYEAQA